MPPEPEAPLATLKSVLHLERRRRYDNKAVVGGLAAFLQRVEGGLALTPPLLAQLRSYGALPVSERQRLVDEALAGLGEPDPPAPSSSGGSRPAQSSAGFSARPDAMAPPPRPLPLRGGEGKHRASLAPSGGEGRQGRQPEGGPMVGLPLRLQAQPGPRSGPGEGVVDLRGSSTRLLGRELPLHPETPLSQLTGVGQVHAKRLAAVGLHTVGDLRLHLPHRYLFYPPPRSASELGFESLSSFEGTVIQVTETPLPGGRRRITALIRDSTGTVAASWIRAGRWPLPIREGLRLAVSGPLIRYGRQITFENPDYEPAEHTPLHTRRIVPIYPLTAGVSQLFLRALIADVLQRLPPASENLPAWLRTEEALPGRQEALSEVHSPSSDERLEAARDRLAVEELLPVELLVLRRREEYRSAPGLAIDIPWSLLAELRRQLPFALTGGQQRALMAILDDMAQHQPMVRLLQGDVGSGKTVVAAMALLAAVANGGQAALIAPTEVLAEQHFRTLSDLYGRVEAALEAPLGHPLRLRFLTGVLSHREREQTLAEIKAGEVDVAVGTHAVIQSDVEFSRLTLAVVDEQHRFGVEQRVALRRKGENPHLLIMTATPIPRTLALTVYGDLDVSLIDEMPPGRGGVETVLLQPVERFRAYERVRAEVGAGHQGFVICPLVEGSSAVEARAAVAEYERLRTADLAGLRLALLHGRMPASTKDKVMRAFAQGEYDVLIATAVVEVGVDIPNATVMLVEGADRFGMAQLYQFRGRIGRGIAPSCCFLVAEGSSPDALSRLEAVARSTSGLDLAEEDLRLRGPGDYFGLRQSGFPALRLANITDLAFVQRVREAAGRVLGRDPELDSPEHADLRAAVAQLQHQVSEAN